MAKVPLVHQAGVTPAKVPMVVSAVRSACGSKGASEPTTKARSTLGILLRANQVAKYPRDLTQSPAVVWQLPSVPEWGPNGMWVSRTTVGVGLYRSRELPSVVDRCLRSCTLPSIWGCGSGIGGWNALFQTTQVVRLCHATLKLLRLRGGPQHLVLIARRIRLASGRVPDPVASALFGRAQGSRIEDVRVRRKSIMTGHSSLKRDIPHAIAYAPVG